MSLRFRTILVAILVSVVLVFMATVNFFSTSRSIDTLASVYEQRMVPSTLLVHMEADLSEIRFRIAGVMLGQISVLGASQQLDEATARIATSWPQFLERSNGGDTSKAESMLIARVDKGLKPFPQFCSRLKSVYTGSDANMKAALASMLEDDWPVIQSSVVKPLEQLRSLQEQGVENTYHDGIREGNRWLVIQAVALLIAVVAIVILQMQFGRIINSSVASLGSVLQSAAGGDLSMRAPESRTDELGAMSRSLNWTLGSIGAIVGKVRQVSQAVASASDAIQGRSEQIASGVESQSSQTAEVASAMEEMTKTISETASNATRTAVATAKAKQAAEGGARLAEETVRAMDRIVASTTDATTIIRQLDNSSERIGAIVGVIDDIADQTDLLALNAAIEAARAGEQGRGFAVVSAEVRHLAERTAAATKEVSGMIRAIQRDAAGAIKSIEVTGAVVEEGKVKTQQMGQALAEIVGLTHNVSDLISQIAAASEEQSSTSAEISQNLEGINSTVQEAATGTKEIHRAATELRRLTESLQEHIKAFTVADSEAGCGELSVETAEALAA